MATDDLKWNNLLILGFLSMYFSLTSGWDYVDRCPPRIRRDDYLKAFKEKCYTFHYRELYWNDALSWCRGQGGTLVEIRNEQIQNFIMQSLHQLGWRRNGVWIGAHDRIHESYWEWASGGQLTWNNWAGDQHGCCFGMLEDCAVLRFRDHGVWHDYPCKRVFFKYSYICEYGK
ncbi:Hypothetical predicted protein [Octopus vulgaris]|uniref:C-type lectin domain-containing protein n=1 Tax=Octopus vulgaris TaxID=6645 RepID=A0AA36BWC6_OCTVU|nr:Hypothetical predicted protein [Octopus vulgaris]